MTTFSPLVMRAVTRMGWSARELNQLVPDTTNALVTTVKSLVLAEVYGDVVKAPDDFQRQLDMLAEAHGALLAALERVVNVRAD